MTAEPHFYRPREGHGLRHNPFNAIVGPRPIGWISSRSAYGNMNLVPDSFCNGVCYDPPLIKFSSIAWTNTVIQHDVYALPVSAYSEDRRANDPGGAIGLD